MPSGQFSTGNSAESDEGSVSFCSQKRQKAMHRNDIPAFLLSPKDSLPWALLLYFEGHDSTSLADKVRLLAVSVPCRRLPFCECEKRSAERSGVQRRSLWQDATPVVRQVSSCKEKPPSWCFAASAWPFLTSVLSSLYFWEDFYPKNNALCHQKSILIYIGVLWTII